MFNFIKNKIILVLGTLFALALVLIKFLYSQNKRKQKQITTLKQNAEIQTKAQTYEIEKTKFDIKHFFKSQEANDDTELDRLDKIRNQNKKNEDEDTTSSVTI